MGEEDGLPKSPEWAAKITGLPARTIKALADEWASKRTTVVIGNGGPAIRGPYSTEPARLQVLCLAMQGLGKPGVNQAKMIEWALGLDPEYQAAPKPLVATTLDAAYRGDLPGEFDRDSLHPQNPGPQAHPRGLGRVVRQQVRHAQRPRRSIHPVQVSGRRLLQDPHDLDRYPLLDHLLERRQQLHPGHAGRIIEFIFCQHPWIENDALFADVILPVNTKLEEDDIGSDVFSGQMDLLYPQPRCIEPLGESFSDYEVVCKIAETTGPARGVHRRHDASPRSSSSATRSSGSADQITWEELNEKGYYVIPTDPDWEKIPAGLIRVLRRSGEASPLDAHRQARVLLHRPGRALPRRRRAAAGTQVDRPR